MKRWSISGLLMAVFFAALAVFILWVNIHKPRLLVVHSYDNDYVWTQDVNKGLQRVLSEHGWLSVHYHYMKTKKFDGAEALRRAGFAARRAIDHFRPDVLIAVDDYAQKLAGQYYVDDPEVSIVFAGINGSIEPYGYDKAHNVTGIVERKPVAALRETLMLLAGSAAAPRAMFLSDTSYSGERDAEHLAEYAWAPVRYVGMHQAEDYAAWQREVLAANEAADYLLVGSYRKLPRHAGAGDYVSPEEVMGWTEANSPVPVIGMNVFNTGDGAMLSVGVSPYEQGEVAARMALSILSGAKRPDQIPIQVSSQYVIALRESALRARHIEVPRVFEAFARATDNYFE